VSAPLPTLCAAASGRWRRPLVWTAVGLALAATFSAYLSPHLVRDLADWAWACFG
jgi:hypothetical protein